MRCTVKFQGGKRSSFTHIPLQESLLCKYVKQAALIGYTIQGRNKLYNHGYNDNINNKIDSLMFEAAMGNRQTVKNYLEMNCEAFSDMLTASKNLGSSYVEGWNDANKGLEYPD